MSTIQWYPGHMAKAMRRLAGDIKLIDLVVEVIDARVPHSGANPALAALTGRRPKLVVLGRNDLADPASTARWLAYFERRAEPVVAINAKAPADVARLRRAFETLGGDRRTARAIVLGIPNAGKSTVINALAGRVIARTEDRAGVTRAAQWFRLTPARELLDTAGILAPRIDAEDARWKLALVGAVPRARFDAEDVVAALTLWRAAQATASGVPDLATFAQSRGFIRQGTVVDMHNAAWSYIKDFNDGKFGRISLEVPHKSSPS